MADENEEAPEEVTEADSPEEESGGGKKKLLIIAIVLALLVVGGGAGAFFMLSGGDSGDEKEVATEVSSEEEAEGEEKAEGEEGEDKEESDEEGEKEGDGEEKAEGEKASEGEGAGKEEAEDLGIDFGDTYQMKTFNLNLGNALENRFVRLEVTLEYSGGDKQKKEIDKRLPQLRDAVISVVSRKTREFLLAPDGKDALRKEVLIRVNRYMKQKIDAVYITDILIE